MSSKNSIQVGIKVRPLLAKEKDQQRWRVDGNSIQLIDGQSEPYYFDHIFDQDASNQMVFDTMVKQIIISALEGINGTVFAYGQTSSGKTYTMMGDENNPGVTILAVKEIFKHIEKSTYRQYLLRVGYIEIYNEKICDLLNKKNTDLKIHEANGSVNVNCEEKIIMSEDDLLNYLRAGNKERTVGETSMNERSSRSHAIFRIIIESRRTDTSEDDTAIQSVLNLVDLAGSERADAAGPSTRLKEGGHINKSLLFLSNVIKRLSENEDDKYISYRDSKLTRILQASLGGNALTAIICTIKPSVGEETNSTLNFAMRAKIIKNKPQVNEIVSDATVMRRLENEIKELKNCLAVERRKNEDQIKVNELEQRIRTKLLKIISCNSFPTTSNRCESRRRTWCPSTTNPGDGTGNGAATMPSNLPVPTNKLLAANSGTAKAQFLSRLQPPKNFCSYTPVITWNSPLLVSTASTNLEESCNRSARLSDLEEEFVPGEMVDFNNFTPSQTPKKQSLRSLSITPKGISNSKEALNNVESQLRELQSFTNLEKNANIKYEIESALKQKLEILTKRNEELEAERLQYIEYRDENRSLQASLARAEQNYQDEHIEHTKLQSVNEILHNTLTEADKRCNILQNQATQLKAANETANDMIAKYESDFINLKHKLEELELENRNVISLEFEFENLKSKFKTRESELLEVLTDKNKHIAKLEKSLEALRCQKFANSKELLEPQGTYIQIQTSEKENRKNQGFESNCMKTIEANDASAAEGSSEPTEVLKEHLRKLENDVVELTSEKTKEVTALNHQLLEAKTFITMLEEKHRKLEDSWQQQQNNFEQLKAEYTAIQNKYQNLQIEYDDLLKIHSSKSSAVDCQRLQNENDALQNDIAKLKEQMEGVQQKLLLHDDSSVESTDSSSTLCAEQQMLPSISNAGVGSDDLLLDSKYEKLRKEYDILSNQMMDTLQENEVIRKENNDLQDALNKLSSLQLKGNKEDSNGVCIYGKDQCFSDERKSQLMTDDDKVLSAGVSGDLTKLHQEHNVRENLAETASELESVRETETELLHLNDEIAKLKKQLEEERLCSKTLLANTERSLSEMREQITKLTSELLEKSTFLDNCCCDTYQKQIDSLLKEKADMIAMYEEKLKAEEQIPNIFNAYESKDFHSTNLEPGNNGMHSELPEENTKDNGNNELIEELKERNSDLELQLSTIREQLQIQKQAHEDKCRAMQLEAIQTLECSVNKYRDNIQKYNREWEESRENYEIIVSTYREHIISLQQLNEECKYQAEKDAAENKFNSIMNEQKINSLVVELESLKKQEEFLENKNSELLQQIDILEKELSDLQTETETKTKTKTKTESETVVSQILKEIQNNVVNHCENAENRTSEVGVKSVQLKLSNYQQMQNECLQKKLNDLNDCLAAKDNISNTVEKQQQQIEQQLEEIESIKESLQQVRRDFEKFIKELIEMEKEKQSLIKQKDEFENRLSKLCEEKEILNAKNCSSEELILKLKEDLRAGQALIEMMKRQLHKDSLQRASIMNEQQILQDNLETLKESNQILTLDKIKLENELHNIQEGFQSLRNDYEATNEKLKLINEEKLKLENYELEKLRFDMLTLEKTSQQLQNNLQQSEEEFNHAEEVISKLKQQITDEQEEKEKLLNNLQTITMEKESLEQCVHDMKQLDTERRQLEETMLKLQENQSAAFNSLKVERDNLKAQLQQYKNSKIEQEDKEKTLCLKIEMLDEEVNQMLGKIATYNHMIKDNEKNKAELRAITDRNEQLDKEILRLKSTLTLTQNEHEATVRQQSERIQSLEAKLQQCRDEESKLQFQTQQLKSTLEEEKKHLSQHNNELQVAVAELQLKYDSLLQSNTDLVKSANELQKQIDATQKLIADNRDLSEQLKVLQVKYNNLQKQQMLMTSVASAAAAAADKPTLTHNNLLQQCKNPSTLRTHQTHILNKEHEGCSIEVFSDDMIQSTDETYDKPNLDNHNKGGNNNSYEQIKFNISAERKSRRNSIYDERRSTCWVTMQSKETMTLPINDKCNCEELDAKLKECERMLFIRDSQVMALNMELKNHPLKDANAALTKRLQDEQDKYHNEIKRCKQKLNEQSLKAENMLKILENYQNKGILQQQSKNSNSVIKTTTNVEVQTENDVSANLQKLQSKYNDLKKICRLRYKTIKELEGKMVAQNENASDNALSGLEIGQLNALQKKFDNLEQELKTLEIKYSHAKVVLQLRQNQINELRGQNAEELPASMNP